MVDGKIINNDKQFYRVNKKKVQGADCLPYNAISGAGGVEVFYSWGLGFDCLIVAVVVCRAVDGRAGVGLGLGSVLGYLFR
jgi:hypothetical protein